MINLKQTIKKIFWSKEKITEDNLTEEIYFKLFIEGRSQEDIIRTYDKAWDSKNIEIENYWKRANYFWLMQTSSFAAYIITLSKSFEKNCQGDNKILYIINCIGIVISLAWWLTNKGSKQWQVNWEKHVLYLEKNVTGPLYKSKFPKRTFSVSKINELVSLYFLLIWAFISISYLYKYSYRISLHNIDWYITVSTFSVFTFIWICFFGYGRGNNNDNNL